MGIPFQKIGLFSNFLHLYESEDLQKGIRKAIKAADDPANLEKCCRNSESIGFFEPFGDGGIKEKRIQPGNNRQEKVPLRGKWDEKSLPPRDFSLAEGSCYSAMTISR